LFSSLSEKDTADCDGSITPSTEADAAATVTDTKKKNLEVTIVLDDWEIQSINYGHETG